MIIQVPRDQLIPVFDPTTDKIIEWMHPKEKMQYSPEQVFPVWEGGEIFHFNVILEDSSIREDGSCGICGDPEC